MFNGEIFNFRDLRKQLEGAGARFRGGSDTEVLVNGFDEWGIEETIIRSIGMFAIVIWDAERQALHLVRDRLGKKPLFVYRTSGTLLFASELKALAASPRFVPTLDVDSLRSYMRYLYVPAPASIFRDVQKVAPGQICTFDRDGDAVEQRAYWSLRAAYDTSRASPFRGSEGDAVDELQSLLVDAVTIRLESDVPVGSLLSGGVDSSTVTAVMQAVSATTVNTFSIGFSVAEHDESRHAAAIARHLGTNHTALEVSAEDALGVVPMLPEMFDEPLADPSQIPTYLVAVMARRKVSVALTGDGGDEIFGGYNRYTTGERLIGAMSRLPAGVRTVLAAVLRAGSAGQLGSTLDALGIAPRLASEKIEKLQRMLGQRTGNDMYRSLLSAWDRPEAALNASPGGADVVSRQLASLADLPLLDRMMLTDQGSYLADDLLAKVDRATMAVSLEARVPLLDHRILEFAWRLPRELKIRGGSGKYILRRVLDRYVPAELVDRPKVGFSVPLDAWLRGPLEDWAGDLLGRAGDPLNGAAIRGMWSRFREGKPGLALQLWTILIFQAWRERWLPR